MPGEELDVTTELSNQDEKQSGITDAIVTPSTESPGLSFLTKLLFFGVIVGIVLAFMKNRKGGITEKSLA